jgi:phage protein D
VTSPGNKFVISIGGSPLKAPVDQLLISAMVDQSLHVADMFELTFMDPDRTVIKDAKIEIGKPVIVKVVNDEVPGGEKLITGEVTTLEAEYLALGMRTTVRGLDPSHKLLRGRATKAYLNVSYSDVARQVAAKAGLQVGKVDPSTPVHEHVTQANVSDWQFLTGLAAEIGFEVGTEDGKFVFRKPLKSATGPAPGTLKGQNPLQLVLGKNLHRFRVIVTSAEQVKSVQVRGWDWKKKTAVVGEAPAKTDSAAVGLKPPQVAMKAGNKKYISVHTPFETQGEATTAAKALADQIAGAFVEFEGVAEGNPKLKAGAVVSLGLVDKPFDGKYVITSARHVYEAEEGYTVRFTASGHQERSLYSLVGGPGASGGGGLAPPVNGVVIALVTNNDDPQKLGRVKVKFPWLDQTYESNWARIASAGAGKDRGEVVLPEVNDEVLVAFEHGDMRKPYVLGGLYNGKDKPNLGTMLVKAGKVQRRGFISKMGHKLVFLDGMTKSGVLLATGDMKMRIALKEKPGLAIIHVASGGKVVIDALTDIEINAKKDVKITATAKMELKATAGIKIDGGQEVEIKGGVIKLN